MLDDLIVIGALAILGLVAHGARHQKWLEWALRLLYGLFLFGEIVWLCVSAGDPTVNEVGWWSWAVVAAFTGLMLFKPFREGLSCLLTAVNQLVVGRVYLALLGRHSLPAKVPQPAAVGTSSEFLPVIQKPESTAAESRTADSAATESSTTESSTTESSTTESSTTGSSTTESSTTESSTTESSATESSVTESSTTGSSATESSATESSTTGSSTTESAAAESSTPSPQTLMAATTTTTGMAGLASMSIGQVFMAEKVFVASSIPHLNALWIYVTVMGYLVATTDFKTGMELPSMPFPMPVTMDQLLFYNGLGLVMLAVCGVGIFVARNWKQVLVRLGIVKPTWTHIMIGIAAVFATFYYDYAWSTYTHSQTGMGYAEKLTGYNEGTFKSGGDAGSAFVLALAVGFFAGVGEETLIRGALQPVFGALPAGFLHGILHGQFSQAPMYIIQVAIWSTLMGVLRRYTNTTTTIITHFAYNFLTTFLFAFNP